MVAPAKINLHLGVGALDDDGFHPLMTVFHAIDLHDEVTVRDADRWSSVVHGGRRRRLGSPGTTPTSPSAPGSS